MAPSIDHKPSRALNGLLALVVAGGILVLAGWNWDIRVFKSVVPGYVSMKANTAVGFLVLGVATFLLAHRGGRVRRLVGLTLAGGAIALAFATLAEYLFKVDLRIDELLFPDPDAMKTRWPPGRFAPVTCINFTLVGTGLFLRELRGRRPQLVGQAAVLIAWVISFQGFVGYLCGVSYSFGSAFYTQIAVHTAALFIALTTAALLSWGDEGFMAAVAGQGVAGRVGRKLLIFAVLVPPLVNLIQVEGAKLGWFDADFGVLLRVVGNVVLFSWMAFQTGSYLSETDAWRAQAERAQQELLASEQQARKEAEMERTRLHSLFIQAPTIINIQRGPEHVFEFVHPLTTQALGRDVQGLGVREALPELEGQGFFELFDEVYRTGVARQIAEMPMRVRLADGSYRDSNWDFVYQAWRDVSGELAGVLTFAVEVTHQVKSRQRIERLQSVTAALAQAMDVQQVGDLLLERGSEALGARGGAVVRRPEGAETLELVASLNFPEELAARWSNMPADVESPVAEVLRTGEPLFIEHQQELFERFPLMAKLAVALQPHAFVGLPIKLNGQVLAAAGFGFTSEVLFDAGTRDYAAAIAGQCALALERAFLFARERARSVELEKALRARDDLLSICSHELRTPVTSMRLQAQLAKRNVARGNLQALAPDRVMKMVDQSDRQLSRLMRLIEEMLDFSRLRSGHLFHLSRAVFDLKDLVFELQEQFKNELESAGCKLAVEVDAPVEGSWDRLRIEQVVVNLLTNAIKYGSSKPIVLSLSQSGEDAVIQVRDQGIGVAVEDMKRIFEPYERAVNYTSISGLGLGLYISRRIVEAHGGTLRVTSELGRGSVFTAVLPRNAVPVLAAG
jgi:signal transduction histidine kinase/PAS domain-containing protein